MISEKQTFRYFDFTHLLIALSICCIGLLFVFSATYHEHAPFSIFFKKQLFGIVTGLGIYALFTVIDYRISMRYGYFTYFFLTAILFFTLIKGSIGMGAQRWLDFGFIRLQPSELAKMLFPAYMVYILSTSDQSLPPPFKTFIPILGMLFISFFLIRRQPDLGTALLVLFVALTLCWIAGLSRTFFIVLACLIIGTLPFVRYVLKPYQQKRIAVFLGYGSADKERYQIEQAHIAIGSGGLCGKGLLHGTQNKLHFLPEGRTDFIFAVLCEEWGLVGALFVLGLYCALFLRSLIIIKQLNDFYMQLLALGLILHIIYSTIINICMVLGLLPVVGIPLPLMSYGLSNLWVNMASLGWFQNIAMQRLFRREL